MATDRYKNLERALLSKDIRQAEIELSAALGIEPPRQHAVRVKDMGMKEIFDLRYRLEWLNDLAPMADTMLKLQKKQKSEIKRLKVQIKKAKPAADELAAQIKAKGVM
jgi:hypothetical protein